ncbi:hypothetical protein L1987_64744 [Smallanthus sonchifolius]|uniref:Uncharacterized protein n=1 Tax=Smallanthus sonchifolius TaxID=185202 RepID=A0ACB9BSM9_9ASTR|nr:hypothetical protein L1987_64744 [Smallanthus sonchifolius]
MNWARVWMQFTTILNDIYDISDTIVFMIASRMVRDSDEIRRRAPSRIISKGFLILDMLLTMMFIFVAVFILNNSTNEMPTMPLRFWIIVFMFYCIFHIFFSIIQYEGGPWSQAGSIMLKNLEYKKNVFGIFLWGLGMFFMVKGADQMFISAPKLTWILAFFLCFDIALAISSMILLFMIFITFCCILIPCATLYHIRDQQNRRRVQLPPCPWCHK